MAGKEELREMGNWVWWSTPIISAFEGKAGWSTQVRSQWTVYKESSRPAGKRHYLGKEPKSKAMEVGRRQAEM